MHVYIYTERECVTRSSIPAGKKIINVTLIGHINYT